MCRSCLHFLLPANKWHFYEILSKCLPGRLLPPRLRPLCSQTPSLSPSILHRSTRPHRPYRSCDPETFAGKELLVATLSLPTASVRPNGNLWSRPCARLSAFLSAGSTWELENLWCHSRWLAARVTCLADLKKKIPQ